MPAKHQSSLLDNLLQCCSEISLLASLFHLEREAFPEYCAGKNGAYTR
jgi:hypothetical protein